MHFALRSVGRAEGGRKIMGKKKNASLSYEDAWKRRIRIKENIAIAISAASLIVAVAALATKTIF